jgi:hypothetical protein
MGTHILSHLLERRVYIGKRGRGIEKDKWKIVKGLNDDHTLQAFHKRDRGFKPFEKEKINDPAFPKDQLKGYSSHKRRDDKRENP